MRLPFVLLPTTTSLQGKVIRDDDKSLGVFICCKRVGRAYTFVHTGSAISA